MQATLDKPVSFEGIGLHTGNYSKLTIEPADTDKGFVFYTGKNEDKIPALTDYVYDTKRGVCLKGTKGEVRTCEHILSALTGMGITNAVLRLSDQEIPALD